ncbi:MAG: hypothetical protein U5L45_21845 [Saprospiraceae bacterium]|nr:hypothetical protein [Saprospiraceae bacterium]
MMTTFYLRIYEFYGFTDFTDLRVYSDCTYLRIYGFIATTLIYGFTDL